MKKNLIGILIMFMLAFSLTGCGNEAKESDKENKDVGTKITLIEKLDYEVNSELQLLSLVKEIDKGTIESEDVKVDTSKLGEQDLALKYLNEKQEEKEYTFKITIVDTEKPKIEFKKELTTTAGTKIDLLKNVSATDNSNEKIKVTVEGNYDFNKAGVYKLKYIAVDSSKNKATEEFTLKVNERMSKAEAIAKIKNYYIKDRMWDCEGNVCVVGTVKGYGLPKTEEHTFNMDNMTYSVGFYFSASGGSVLFVYNMRTEKISKTDKVIWDAIEDSCYYITAPLGRYYNEITYEECMEAYEYPDSVPKSTFQKMIQKALDKTGVKLADLLQ